MPPVAVIALDIFFFSDVSKFIETDIVRTPKGCFVL